MPSHQAIRRTEQSQGARIFPKTARRQPLNFLTQKYQAEKKIAKKPELIIF